MSKGKKEAEVGGGGGGGHLMFDLVFNVFCCFDVFTSN